MEYEIEQCGLGKSGKPKTVQVEDLDSAWKDPSLRIEKGGANGIGDRYKNVQEFLKDNEKVWMPEVSVNKAGEVIFVDGRHRFAALRDMGVKEIKVMMKGANNWKK